MRTCCVPNSAHDGKHLPKATSSLGDPLMRIFLRSKAHSRLRSFATNPSHVSLSAVTIRDGTLQVRDGHQGEADLRVTADSETWLGFLAKERSLLWALLRRKIRIKGSPGLLVAFGKCFPS